MSSHPKEFPERRPSSKTTMRRSRYGCRNCKLRKVKCDEGKPQCGRCSSFGVLCNFHEPGMPDLQPVVGGRGAGLEAPITSAVWTCDGDGSAAYQLDARCQDFVTRYLGWSLITPDDPNMREVNRKLLGLAFTHPFLMHASLAVALAYDRYLQHPLPPRPHRALQEAHHTHLSTSLFTHRLRSPIAPHDTDNDKDAIWGTAAALALLTFCTPDPEPWPLAPSSSTASHFAWLRMSTGKMSLWRAASPLRPGSLFAILAPTYAQMDTPAPASGIAGITDALARVCGLDDSSNTENNAYFGAAHAVAMLQGLRDSEVTLGRTEVFTKCVKGGFEAALWEKDPVALLLLFLWYCEAGRGVWWVEVRARVEGPAICEYLRRYHNGYSDVIAFLPGGILAG